MRYIKLYEKFKSGDEKRTEELFSPLIDWDMIDDVKEMSLEYLDNDKELQITIYYNIIRNGVNTSSGPNKFQLFSGSGARIDITYIKTITFSHLKLKEQWSNLSILTTRPNGFENDVDVIDFIKDKIEKEDISYKIYLCRSGSTVDTPGKLRPVPNITDELVDRIKEFYPDLRIFTPYYENNTGR